MVDGFREGTFKLLAFIETKLKSNGEVLWGKLKGIIVGVQEIEVVREDVALLMNDEWHNAVIDF